MSGDGYVDFIELVERLNLIFFGSQDAQLHAYFNVFDLDGSKAITKSEMEEVLRALTTSSLAQKKVEEIRQHEIVNSIFKKADTNNDQHITLNEFLTLSEVEGINFRFHDRFVEQFGLDFADRTRRN